MCKATVVIDVQVREHNLLHVARFDTECAKLRTDLLLTLDTKIRFPSNVGMKGLGAVEQIRPLARVDDNHAFRMVDDPRIGREPPGPAFDRRIPRVVAASRVPGPRPDPS
jgi:hypothetical protein